MANDNPEAQKIYGVLNSNNDSMTAQKMLRAAGDKCQQEAALQWIAKQSSLYFLSADFGPNEKHDDVLHYLPGRQTGFPILHIEDVADSCNSK